MSIIKKTFDNIISNKYLRKAALFKFIFRYSEKLAITILFYFSPVVLAKLRYFFYYQKMLDLKSPKTFDEKLLWLNLYWQHPIKSICADKYTLRSYVRDMELCQYLPKLYGVYKNSGEIEFDDLPMAFALKCNHGCGLNILCQNKTELDVEATKQKLDSWLTINFSEVYGESHYKKIKPLIFAEEYLGDESGRLPVDYKVFCFDGKVHCTLVCIDRMINQHTAKWLYYDRCWNKLFYSKSNFANEIYQSKPVQYSEMMEAAERLSQGIPFVRVDFYIVDNRLLLGEMTFTPNGCIDPGMTEYAQNNLGELLKLPCDNHIYRDMQYIISS